jgi:hypothetical protein
MTQSKPLPWFSAWLLGFHHEENSGRFESHTKISKLMHTHIEKLLLEDEKHARAIYKLFSTQNVDSVQTLQRIKQLLVSECACTILTEPYSLSWDDLVREWLAHEQTTVEAKNRTGILYAVLSKIPFFGEIHAEIPKLEKLQAGGGSFQEFVVQFSLDKIFREYLKIKPSPRVLTTLHELFCRNDTSRKFILNFALLLSTGGLEKVRSLQNLSFVVGVLKAFVEACKLLFTLKAVGVNDKDIDLSPYFDLFFFSRQEGRDFFSRRWLSSDELPIVPTKFFDAFTLAKDRTSEDALLSMCRIALPDTTLFIMEEQERLFLDAWLYVTNEGEKALDLLDFVEKVFDTPLTNRERILLFSRASTIPSSYSKMDNKRFLSLLDTYHFSLLQKKILLIEFLHGDLNPHIQYLEEIEEFVGHKLPSITAFTVLFLHDQQILDAVRIYRDLRQRVCNLSKTRLGIPFEDLEMLKKIDLKLSSECTSPVLAIEGIDLEQYYGATICHFAHLSICSLTNYDDNEFGREHFFPFTVPTGKEEQEYKGEVFVLIPQYKELSITYNYTWKEEKHKFIYQLNIVHPAKSKSIRIDVPLPITSEELKKDHVAEVIHWMIRIFSQESVGVKELDPNEQIEDLLKRLGEDNCDLPLHLPWDKTMEAHVLSAYHFVRHLRIRVRMALSSSF